MKKQFPFLVLAAMLFAANFIFAQAPNSFNYQAVLRNASGNLLTSGNVDMRFTIRTGTTNGTIQYQETKSVAPNQYGLVNHVVGTGILVTGTMDSVTWGSGNKYLQVEANTGNGFVSIGTQQLVSVPYAISSGDNQWIKTGYDISNKNLGNVGIGTTTPATNLEIYEDYSSETALRLSNYSPTGRTSEIRLGSDGSLKFSNHDPNGYWLKKQFEFLLDNGSPIITVMHDGRVGIGTDGPVFPLEVVGSTPITVGGWFHEYTSSTLFYQNGTTNVGICSRADVYAPGFLAASDIRIKNDIVRSQSVNDLSTINQLKVTDYHYIDKVEKGGKLQKGFIAQEVKKVIPEAITTVTEFIPDIYSVAKKIETRSDGKTIITTPKPHELKVNDKVRLITATKDDYTVENVIDEHRFEVKGLPANTKDVFVYGKKVDDFNVVNYDRIFTTGIGAIQELSKQIDLLKAENATLKTQLSSSNAANASLAADVELIKAQISLRSQVSPK